jgi:hypothetical protein
MPSRATTIVLTCALVLFRNSTQTSNRPVEETVVIVSREASHAYHSPGRDKAGSKTSTWLLLNIIARPLAHTRV